MCRFGAPRKIQSTILWSVQFVTTIVSSRETGKLDRVSKIGITLVRENETEKENEAADTSRIVLFISSPRHVPGVVNFQCIRNTIEHKSHLLYFCRQSRRDSWIISETLRPTWPNGVIYDAWDTIQIANVRGSHARTRDLPASDGCLTFVFYYFAHSLNTTASVFVFCALLGEIFIATSMEHRPTCWIFS